MHQREVLVQQGLHAGVRHGGVVQHLLERQHVHHHGHHAPLCDGAGEDGLCGSNKTAINNQKARGPNKHWVCDIKPRKPTYLLYTSCFKWQHWWWQGIHTHKHFENLQKKCIHEFSKMKQHAHTPNVNVDNLEKKWIRKSQHHSSCVFSPGHVSGWCSPCSAPVLSTGTSQSGDGGE